MQHNPPSVAVIGCGYWGKNIVRNFAELGQLRAVSDPHRPNAEAMSRQHGVPVADIDQLLGDDGLAGVAIAAPAPLHADIACRCLAAGKHVFVEKPIALDPADALRMIKAAETADRTLMVGHLLNYHPAFLKVVELVGRGEIGALRRIYSNRLSMGKLRVDENVMWSFAPHDLSMILRLTGSQPVHVQASGAAYITPGVHDYAHVHMAFEGGVTAHVFASWLHPFKEQRLVVTGERGSMVFDDTAPVAQKVALYRHGEKIENGQLVLSKGDVEFIDFDAGEPLRNECQAFLDAMSGVAKPYTDGAEGLRVLDVLSRAQMSLNSTGS